MKKSKEKQENGKELFYYIIYEYNADQKDIFYKTSKKTLIDSINYVNDLLLIDKDYKNYIKDIESIVKYNNISKYITLDINNLKVINNYIIYKQYIDKEVQKRSILSKLEKQAINNNDLIINKIYKKEHITYKCKKRTIKLKPLKVKTLDKKDAFKKYMEIKKKIENNFNKVHENKNIIIGGALYE